jgi:hypothetical protein
MIKAYKQIVQKELGDFYKVFSTVVYPTEEGIGYIMIGVAKGWTPREVNINLIEGNAYDDFVSDLEYQMTEVHMQQISRSLAALPKRFLSNKNVREQIVEIIPEASSRTVKYFEEKLNSWKRELHQAFSMMDIAKNILDPSLDKRSSKKAMDIPFDYVLERRAIMATKEFDYRSTDSWKAIGVELGMSESWGYGQLRPRTLEYLEETEQVDPFVKKMNQRKAGIKAGAKRKANARKEKREKEREMNKLQKELDKLNEEEGQMQFDSKAEKYEFAYNKRKEGLNHLEIAELMGESRGNIYYYVKRHTELSGAKSLINTQESPASSKTNKDKQVIEYYEDYQTLVNHYVENDAASTAKAFSVPKMKVANIIGRIRNGSLGEDLQKYLFKRKIFVLLDEGTEHDEIIKVSDITKAQLNGYLGQYAKHKQAN